jgi:hypothetical protein
MSITVNVIGQTNITASILNQDVVGVSVGTFVAQAVTGLLIAGGDNVTVATTSGVFTISAASPPVLSVNGKTGAVAISASDVTAAAATHTHVAADITDLASVVTNVSITASVNNYQLPAAEIFRIQNPTVGPIQITGFVAGAPFEPKLLINVSTGASSSISLVHQGTASTAVNRIINPLSEDYLIPPSGGAALVLYDDQTTRWRII